MMPERGYNYCDLPGDRELDALVAKHIRGECLHDPDFTTDVTPIEKRDRGRHYQCRRCGEIMEELAFIEDIYTVWKPSANLNQAMETWIALAQQKEFRPRLEQVDGGWVASCGDLVTARGETPAAAICHAMLRAVGVTETPVP